MPSPLRPYAVFYFCFYAVLGAYTPYVARFVDHLGYSGMVAGAMLGLWYGSRIVAPPLWARLLRRSAAPRAWLVAGCFFATAGFAAFGFVQALPALFLAMAFFGFFYNAAMPQFEAMSLAAIVDRPEAYSRLRVWGSVGFLVVAGTYGALLDAWGEALFVWATLPWAVLMVAAAAMLPAGRSHPLGATMPPAAMRQLWRRPGVRPLLVLALLVQAGFGAFYVFYTLHLGAAGHGGGTVGLLWTAGVLAEIALFWRAPALIRRHGVRRLMAICLAVTVLRWIVVALAADSLAWMWGAQLTHALGFALFHACLMQRMATLFPGAEAAAGQGLLYGFSSGLGGVLGAVLAAGLWEWHGGDAAFLGGALLTAAALALHLRTPATPHGDQGLAARA